MDFSDYSRPLMHVGKHGFREAPASKGRFDVAGEPIAGLGLYLGFLYY